jgi:hypothetical protein
MSSFNTSFFHQILKMLQNYILKILLIIREML